MSSSARRSPNGGCDYTLRIRPVFRSLAVGTVALVVLSACSDDPDPNAPTSKPVLDVTAEQCLQVDAGLAAEVSKLPVIDCTKPHTHEIFATVKDTVSKIYPGFDALELFAERECFRAFDGFVGISPFDSDLFISWIVPSLDGWNDEDDRSVLCVLGPKSGEQLNFSVKDKKI